MAGLPELLDLNCDLGEGIAGTDELIPWITSANICCGEHAGSEEQIQRTLARAVEHNVVIGAHPGHTDREHFGRRPLEISERQLAELLSNQVGQLKAWAQQQGGALRYLKLHGALYHQANQVPELAEMTLQFCSINQLALVCPPNGQLMVLGKLYPSVQLAPEGFADRLYDQKFQLVSRENPGAIISDVEVSLRQLEQLTNHFQIRTLCVHGDHPGSESFLMTLRQALLDRNIRLESFV
ncbi:MAG: LamB/YcsF family protein [Zavarzinella sp.]